MINNFVGIVFGRNTQLVFICVIHNGMYCIAGNISRNYKFGSWASNCHCKNIGRFKFGGWVRDRYTYNASKKMNIGGFLFGDCEGRPPNLIPHQILWLHGSILLACMQHTIKYDMQARDKSVIQDKIQREYSQLISLSN